MDQGSDEVASAAWSGYHPPQTEAERTLASIWCSVLDVERVSLTDNFLDLGATSVLLVKAVAEAERVGLCLDAAQFVEAENLRDLAALARPVPVATGQAPPASRLSASRLPASRLSALSGDDRALPSVVFLPSMSGSQISFAGVARKMAVSGSVWSWRLPGLDAGAAPFDSLPDMATAFREEVIRWPPSVLGQVTVSGLSFGGLLAFQVMTDLQQVHAVRTAVVIAPPLLRRKPRRYWREMTSILWQQYSEMLALPPEDEFGSLALGERSFLIAQGIAANLDRLSDEWLASRFLPPREALTRPDAVGRLLAVQFCNMYAVAVYAPDLSSKCSRASRASGASGASGASRAVAIVPYGDIPQWGAIQSSWDGFEWDAVYFVPGTHTKIHHQSPETVAEIIRAEADGVPEEISPSWLTGPD